MDEGSGINILYKDAFGKLGVNIRKLHASQSPFHGIMPGRCVMPLGTIELSMTFGDVVHYRKETLSFKVVDFQGPYRRPCYTKFMAVPSYAYLKLKMPGPKGVITVFGNFQSAYQCQRDAVEYAEANALDEGARVESRSGALRYPCSTQGKTPQQAATQSPPVILDPSSSTSPPTSTPGKLIIGT
jgi:hypothetical protein